MTLRDSTESVNLGSPSGLVGHTLVCPFVRPITPIVREPKNKPQRHKGHEENRVILTGVEQSLWDDTENEKDVGHTLVCPGPRRAN